MHGAPMGVRGPRTGNRPPRRYRLSWLTAPLSVFAFMGTLLLDTGGTATAVQVPESPDGQSLDDLRAQREELRSQGRALVESLNGQPPNADQSGQLRTLNERITQWEGAVTRAEADAQNLAGIQQSVAAGDAARAAGRPPMYPNVDPQVQVGQEPLRVGSQVIPRVGITPGDRFVEDQAYAEWLQRYPDGGPAEGINDRSRTIDFEGPQFRQLLGMPTATEKLRTGLLTPDRMRALVSAGSPQTIQPAVSGSTPAGTLITPDYRGLMEPGLLRPLTIRDLVTVIPVSTPAIQWAREKSRTHAATMVEEATATTGESGTKPEGDIQWELVTTVVKTIAAWVAATKNVLADAAFLRGFIDQYLTYDLALELEDQMASGDGTGDNFLGILNDPDIQSVAYNTAGLPTEVDNLIDLLRVAKRMVRVVARTNASAIVVNPEDAEIIDIIKADTAGIYLGSNPYAFTPNTQLWALPLVESEAVPVKTAIVGDFRRAVLFDREQTTISVGTAGNDFIRNMLRILAELRAGFALIRPKAFVKVTLRA